MELFLIRHPKPADCDGLCYGRSDLALEPGWQAAFERMKQLLPQTSVVYSSPLRRCLEPANLLGDGQPVVNPLLVELDFGLWEGKLWNELPEEETRAWSLDLVNGSPPGGESGQQLMDRQRAFTADLKNAGQDAMILTHSGWIRAFLADVLDISLETAFRLNVDFAGVTHVSFSGDWVQIQYVNRVQGASL